jgi:hypothetical protein
MLRILAAWFNTSSALPGRLANLQQQGKSEVLEKSGVAGKMAEGGSCMPRYYVD